MMNNHYDSKTWWLPQIQAVNIQKSENSVQVKLKTCKKNIDDVKKVYSAIKFVSGRFSYNVFIYKNGIGILYSGHA